ncbi:MAG TPA: endonuclease/exonuclease/phosphatase family protein [Spirochaetia bacterium]|nr:endonuclease/exonuclease/phosphatase family protein [Spirochaetia bacterium]
MPFAPDTVPSPNPARVRPGGRARLRGPAAALAALAALSPLCACPLAGPRPGEDSLLVMSYNVKSLFDAVDSGSEFPEFSVAEGRWDEARYKRRLSLLAEVILAAAPGKRGPDLLCLAEIENRGVLRDLAAGPLKGSGYRETALVEAPGQAFQCGLVSRLPLLSLKAHGLSAGGSEGRYLLEAEVAWEDSGRGSPGPGKPAARPLVVFVCHWKSKVGGAEATEAERREAAALLAGRAAARLAADPACELLACGDFNESPDEYLRTGMRYATALWPDSAGAPPGPALVVAGEPGRAGLGEGRAALYSPWAAAAGCSYVHEGREERIDGFLLGPGLLDGEGLSLSAFAPMDEAFLLGSDGAPRAWSSSSGSGYSDHLPLLLELSREGR